MDELRTSIRRTRAEDDRSAGASTTLRSPQPSALEEAVGRSLALAFERLDRTATGPQAIGESAPAETLRAGRGGDRVPEERRLSVRPAAEARPPADIPPEPFADGPADATPAPMPEVAADTTLRAVAAAVDAGLLASFEATAQDAPFRDAATGAGTWRPARGREGVDGTKRPFRNRLLWGAAAGEVTADRQAHPTGIARPSPARTADPVRSRPAVAQRRPFPAPALAGGATSPSQTAVGTASDGLARAPVPRDGRTLEDVAADLLRPMLREWLQANLPAVVERQVAAEIARLARTR